MVELVSSIAVITFCTAVVVVISSDIRKVMHRLRYDKYMCARSKCLHEYEGRILDDRVCIYCGKVLMDAEK